MSDPFIFEFDGEADQHALDSLAYLMGAFAQNPELAAMLNQDRLREAIKERLQRDMGTRFEQILRDGNSRGNVRTPPSPERRKALVQLRQLKALRDSTTFEGERTNAQAAMDRLMTKHEITDREL